MKFLLTSFLIIIVPFQTSAAQDSSRYGEGEYRFHAGTVTELTMVYMGAYTCAPCKLPSVKAAIETIKVELHKRAKTEEKQFSTIGIANDFSVEKGWEFLNSSGYFDEVIIGKNFLNTGNIEFVLTEESVDYAIPQIIVFEQEISIDNAISIGERKYLVRISGSEEIEAWAANGARFDSE